MGERAPGEWIERRVHCRATVCGILKRSLNNSSVIHEMLFIKKLSKLSSFQYFLYSDVALTPHAEDRQSLNPGI